VALTDQALVDGLAALWSSPYDAATVAALYPPDAVFQDNIAKESSTGLEAIGAKVKGYADRGFKVANTSAPIRQDEVVAVFQEFGAGADRSPGLGVVEMKDGKVQKMWEYPAGSSPASGSSALPVVSDDEDLMKEINAIWGGTADTAAVAALYAPDAVFHDTIEGKTYTGIEAIAAKAEANAAAGFKCEQGSSSIRQGNVVAVFHRFNAGGPTFPVLAVFEVKDSKGVAQWAYPAP
jgi:ketosteroid isomerase-like protein